MPATKILQHAIEIIKAGRFTSSALPWLKERGLPLPMSLAAFAFDRYRRQRNQLVPAHDLSGVCWPSVPGLVTIVLPVYNGAKYLSEAIDSVLAQTYPHWELIAVNDGSTDNSGEILEEYAGKNPRIQVIHQPNQKLPRALENGFQAAHGEYLTWISCDNRLYPDFLARLVGCFRRHAAWDMVYANQDLIGEDGQPLSDSDWFRTYQRPFGSPHIWLPRDPSELNIRNNNFVGAAFLYRKRVMGLLGGYSSSRYTTEDYDYWMRVNALMHLRHADFDAPVLAYRFHGTSLTSQERELDIQRRRAQLLRFDDFRRDFYLTPLIWQIDCQSGIEAQKSAGSFCQLVKQFGHRCLGEDEQELKSLPRYWFPVIQVCFAEKPMDAGMLQREYPGVERVLVLIEGQNFVKAMPSGWDLCIALGKGEEGDNLNLPEENWVLVDSIEMLFTALDIWVRERHISLLEQEEFQPSLIEVKLSVVICTHKRGDRLEKAIASVAAQDFPSQDFELIVVNNAPDDTTLPGRVERMQDRYFPNRRDQLRLVQCPHLGLSFARNAGLAEARGEIVCYLDDDALAEPDWLTWIWQACSENPKAGVIGGPILLKKPEKLPIWWRPGMETHWSNFAPDYEVFRVVTHWTDFPWGANWCARRQVLLELGGFRTRYGRRGANYKSAEEIIAAVLVQKAGFEIGVEPRARVRHDVDPSRFSLRHVWGMLMGGRESWYQAQMDLHIPWELGVRQGLRRIWKAFWPPSSRTLLRGPYTLLAEIITFAWWAADLARRLRRPVSLD